MHYVLNASLNSVHVTGLVLGLVWLGGRVTCAHGVVSMSQVCTCSSPDSIAQKTTWHQAASTGETEAAAELGFGSWSWSWRRSFVFCMERKSSRLFGALPRHIPVQWCHTMSRADLTAALEPALAMEATLDGACASARFCILNIYALQRVSCTKTSRWEAGEASWNVNSANSFKDMSKIFHSFSPKLYTLLCQTRIHDVLFVICELCIKVENYEKWLRWSKRWNSISTARFHWMTHKWCD